MCVCVCVCVYIFFVSLSQQNLDPVLFFLFLKSWEIYKYTYIYFFSSGFKGVVIQIENKKRWVVSKLGCISNSSGTFLKLKFLSSASNCWVFGRDRIKHFPVDLNAQPCWRTKEFSEWDSFLLYVLSPETWTSAG